MKKLINISPFVVLACMFSFMGWFTNLSGGANFMKQDGSTNVSVPLYFYVPGDGTNPGLGVVAVTAGNTELCYQRVGADSTCATVTVGAVGNIGTHTDNKVTPLTKGRGGWQADVPDAAFAAGVDWVDIWIQNDVATVEADSTRTTVRLVPWNPDDAGLGNNLDVGTYHLNSNALAVRDNGTGMEVSVQWITNGAIEGAATANTLFCEAIESGADLIGTTGSPVAATGETDSNDHHYWTTALDAITMTDGIIYNCRVQATIDGSTRTDGFSMSKNGTTVTLGQIGSGGNGSLDLK